MYKILYMHTCFLDAYPAASMFACLCTFNRGYLIDKTKEKRMCFIFDID